MTRPLREDIEARESLELLERAVRTNDPALALEAAQRIARLRPRYSLHEVGVPSDDVRQLIRARFPGLCTQCGAPVAVDSKIAYDKATRRVTCASCVGAAP